MANLLNIVITVMAVCMRTIQCYLEVEQGQFQSAVFTEISSQKGMFKSRRKAKRRSYGERGLE